MVEAILDLMCVVSMILITQVTIILFALYFIFGQFRETNEKLSSIESLLRETEE